MYPRNTPRRRRRRLRRDIASPIRIAGWKISTRLKSPTGWPRRTRSPPRISTSLPLREHLRAAAHRALGLPAHGVCRSIENGRLFYCRATAACSGRRRSTCAPASSMPPAMVARSKRAVAGRIDLARAVHAVARCDAAGLCGRRGRRRLGNRSRAIDRHRRAICADDGVLGALLRSVVDARFARASSTRAIRSRRRTRCWKRRSPATRSTTTASARRKHDDVLIYQRQDHPGWIVNGNGHRRRPLRVHSHVSRRRQQQPAALHRSRQRGRAERHRARSTRSSRRSMPNTRRSATTSRASTCAPTRTRRIAASSPSTSRIPSRRRGRSSSPSSRRRLKTPRSSAAASSFTTSSTCRAGCAVHARWPCRGRHRAAWHRRGRRTYEGRADQHDVWFTLQLAAAAGHGVSLRPRRPIAASRSSRRSADRRRRDSRRTRCLPSRRTARACRSS